MSTSYNLNGRSRLPSDHSAEARPDRIMRYCLGKSLAPSGEEGTQSTRDGVDTDTGANVPPFGRVQSLTDEKRHEKLWEFDIKRLQSSAETSDFNQLQLAVGEHDAWRSWHICGENFAQLGKVADQILYSLWLFTCEDDGVLRKHGFRSLNPGRDQHVFWNFKRIKRQIPDLPGKTHKAGYAGSSEDEDPFEMAKMTAMSDLRVTERDQYCFIVDEVTSILAHIAWHSSGSSYWKMVVLACLAKISTKLKVLATQLPQAIARYTSRSREHRSYSKSHFDKPKQPIVAEYCKNTLVYRPG